MGLETVKRIGVVGFGLMGSQIAEVMARVGGYHVVIWDLNRELLDRGLNTIGDSMRRFFVDKGKMSAEEVKQVVARIEGTTSCPMRSCIARMFALPSASLVAKAWSKSWG